MRRDIITRAVKGEAPLEQKIITVRATVVREQEGVLTVRLEDGFGRAEVVVHKDKTAGV